MIWRERTYRCRRWLSWYSNFYVEYGVWCCWIFFYVYIYALFCGVYKHMNVFFWGITFLSTETCRCWTSFNYSSLAVHFCFPFIIIIWSLATRQRVLRYKETTSTHTWTVVYICVGSVCKFGRTREKEREKKKKVKGWQTLNLNMAPVKPVLASLLILLICSSSFFSFFFWKYLLCPLTFQRLASNAHNEGNQRQNANIVNIIKYNLLQTYLEVKARSVYRSKQLDAFLSLFKTSWHVYIVYKYIYICIPVARACIIRTWSIPSLIQLCYLIIYIDSLYVTGFFCLFHLVMTQLSPRFWRWHAPN